MLVRTTPKMVFALRRSAVARGRSFRAIWVFDEHWGTSGGSMHHVYHSMLVGGELHAAPRCAFIQDIVFMPGKRSRAFISRRLGLVWREGRLELARRRARRARQRAVRLLGAGVDLDLIGVAECLSAWSGPTYGCAREADV